MAFIIGLGGSGVRFVQTLIEQENRILDGALTFDSTSAEEAAGNHAQLLQYLGIKWKHVCLASEKSTLESVINAGVDVSFQSDNSQLALKQLASWRPSKEFINLPLDMGAGSIRAVGRSISIASTHVLQTELAQIQKDDICLVASTDGSTGSTLLIDVLEILNRTAPKARLTIVALNSIVVKGVSDIAHCANSVATLCELETYFTHYLNKAPSQIHPLSFEFPGSRSLFVVNRQDSDQVKFAIEQLPNWLEEGIKYSHFLAEEQIQISQKFDEAHRKKNRQLYYDAESRWRHLEKSYFYGQEVQVANEIRNSLEIAASRFLDRIHPLQADPARLRSMWAYCRSRILTEFVEPEIVTKCIGGWLTALCLNRLQIDNNQVRITDENGETHEFFILRPINQDGIDALPSVIESAPIALRSDPRSTAFGLSAIKTLLHYGETDSRSFFGEKVEITTPATSVLHAEIRNFVGFVGLGAPLKSTPQTENLSPSEIARNNLLAQREFSLHLIFNVSYNGDEAVHSDGRIDPPETFFRDIVDEYFAEIESRLSPPESPLSGLPRKSDTHNRPRTKVQKKTATSTRKWRPLSGRLAATNAKPFGWIRYGIPVLLGILSAAIATYFAIFSNSDEQQTWGNSATIVSGFMAGAAVCLGAVALIFSIQNSSVRIQRADRLYEACLGVQEAITLFELGREAASATNDIPSDSKTLWDDPSLHLAAMMLGSKLKIAMDTGLYRLLAFSDFKNKVDTNTIASASALQAFLLIDGLVRIAPEIVYEKERPRSELISTPDQILETARKLNENLSQITYKMVSKSLEFTPSTNL
jgi:hypothetical protein